MRIDTGRGQYALNDTTGIAQRVATLGRIEGERLSETPPSPKSAKIELDSGCNLSCSFCTRTLRGRQAARMPRDLFERIVIEMRSAGVDQLGLFYMSEPFVSGDLPEAIRWAKQVAGMPYVFLTTNGIAASADRVRACFEAGLDSLKFALNFADERQLQSSVPAGATIRGIVSNIRDARRARDEVAQEHGHRCRLSVSSLEVGPTQRERMAPLVAEISQSVDEHYWLPLFGRPNLAPVEDRLQWSGESRRKAIPCWTLFSEAHVRADGRLSACCLDASDRFVMGDLNRTSFIAAWHSDAFQSLRDVHLRGEVVGSACEDCIGFR